MIYLDIETNTSHDTIWLCVTMKDGVLTRWRNPKGLLEYLGDDEVCGHNIIGFVGHNDTIKQVG